MSVRKLTGANYSLTHDIKIKKAKATKTRTQKPLRDRKIQDWKCRNRNRKGGHYDALQLEAAQRCASRSSF